MKKVKVSVLRTQVAEAKTAWQNAKKSAKPAEEVKKLRAAYELKLALLESAEADGVKDDQEIDLPTGWKLVDGQVVEDKAGEGNGANGQVVELKELTTAIGEAVRDQIKTLLPQGANADSLTVEKVTEIVTNALKAHSIDAANKVTTEGVKAVVGDAVKEAMKEIKQPGKMRFNTSDGKGGGDQGGGDDRTRSLIEIPYSLTKGNLPLHMKQLLNRLLGKSMNEGIPDSIVEEGTKLGDNMFLALRSVGVKAITTTGTGTGAEWVPRDLGAELLRRLYLESQLAQMMLAREIDMPTDPYDLPMQTTRPKFYRNNVQNREARASTPGTGKFTLATQRLMALVQYSYEADEDSIIPILPLLQRLLGEAAAESLESMLINGDSAATHMDADITDPDDVNKSWDGFRKLALASAALKVDMATGGINRANLLSLKRATGKWGRRPSDLVWIVGGLGENHFLGLDEVITADKRGSAGTTQTGVINSYWGIPIVVSEVMREDLNAAGVYDATTTTKASVLLVNLSQFVLGSRRDFMIETAKNIKSQTNDIVASFRKAFKPVETPSASFRAVSIGYNFNA